MKKLILLLALVGCSGSQSKTASVETDLCKARSAFRIAEIADSGLHPASGSLRAKLEEAEDSFCLSK